MSVPDQDPDYEEIAPPESNRFAVFQRGAHEAAVRKIDTILESQFQREITFKETELDSIEQRLLEGRFMLDHLRACVIARYYATVYQIIESDNSTDIASVHPAIKQYIGKSVLEPQRISNEDQLSQLPTVQPDLGQQKNESSEQCTPSAVENVAGVPRLKSKFCFVVGNVSKFLLPDSRFETNDQATHKWMVYVRGDKDNPDISHLVKKVVFFLHPSYRPNDLVSIMNPPFHLARRGWGEFPVRVQIHFHDCRNKPLDVIHNLKLDKTFTGLQTLGAETIAHIKLLTTPTQLAVICKNLESQKHSDSKDAPKTKNNILARSPTKNAIYSTNSNPSISPQTFNSNKPNKRASTSSGECESPIKLFKLARNSCFKEGNNVKQNNTLLKTKSKKVVVLPNDANTNGANVSFQTSPINKNDSLPQERTFQLLLEDGKLLNVKIQPGHLLNSLNSAVAKTGSKNHEKNPVPSQKASNLEIRKHPHEDIRIEVYGTVHQIMFQLCKYFPLRKTKQNWKEFLSWPFGKQRAVEWQRAKKMQRFLQKLLEKGTHPVLSTKDVWTTKAIVLWCRKYGFTPIDVGSFGRLFPDEPSSEPMPICTLTYAKDLLDELEDIQHAKGTKDTSEVENVFIDVESTDDSKPNSANARCETVRANTALPPSEVACLESDSPYVEFVRSISSEAGFRYVQEQVEPGVVAPTVEMSMAAVCKEFLHRLLHTTLSCRTQSGNVKAIAKDDVCRGVLALPEAEFLTNKNLGILTDKTQQA